MVSTTASATSRSNALTGGRFKRIVVTPSTTSTSTTAIYNCGAVSGGAAGFPSAVAPTACRGDRGLQPAPPTRRGVGADDSPLQLGEHLLAARLRGIVGGSAEVLVRQRQ